MSKGALAGVRVLDFSWAWAGPYATLLMAYMGAEIVKIESLKRPDHTRIRSITTAQLFDSVNKSWVFNEINLDKLGGTLDLSQPEGVELAKGIVSVSDIVVENFRPGVMERLGLGYSALKQVRPDIIYLATSACGSSGPEKHYVGYAPIFAAIGGLSYITGYPDAAPSMLLGSVDLRVAVTSVVATLAALYYRRKTGQGQYIDLSAQESQACLMGEIIMDYTMNGRVQSRTGNRDEIMAPHNCYRCQGNDSWISIAVSTEDEWKALCKAIGSPGWTKEERFGDAYSRWKNQEELDKLIGEWTCRYTPYEAMEILQKAGVAAMPSCTGKDLFLDPHLKERGLYTEVEHPEMGKKVVIGPPWKLSDTPAGISRHAPLLGEHNEYIFGELLGISTSEIDRLVEKKVIY